MPPSCQFASAVHLMVVLAFRGENYVTSNEIAESTGTHPVVLRRIAGSLSSAGLVETQKGPGGGIRLAKSAEQITLDLIYSAVETAEPLHLPHTAPNQGCPVGRAMENVLTQIFQQAETALTRELNTRTLGDVMAMVQGFKAEKG